METHNRLSMTRDKNECRIGLVGLGEAGFTIHLPALTGMSRVTVVGAADSDSDRRSRAAAKFGTPVFPDLDALLAETSPDVVVIGTPPAAHAEGCLRAIAAGAHVICEKPFVSSLAEADQVLEAAARAGRHVAVNHQFREMPIFSAVTDEVRRVGVDTLAFVQIWQLMDMPPWTESGWRGAMTQRTLFEAGIHLVDFAMALFGEPPVSVQAAISAGGGPKASVDAVVLVTLEFSRGRLAHITQDRVCKGATQYFEVRAETPDGSVRASFGGRSRLTAGLYRSRTPHVRIEHGVSGLAWTETGARRRVLARNPKDPMVVATRTVFEKTLKAFRTGSNPPTSGRQARTILKVIVACYQAAMTGRRVGIDDAELDGLTSVSLGGSDGSAWLRV